MNIQPPIDPITADLARLLDAHGITAEWLNANDGDPYSRPNVMRAEITETTGRIPWHYRAAVLDHDGIRTWVQQLVADATEQRGNSVLTSIGRGPSLLVLGPTGTGKTHLAYAAMREFSVSGVRNYWRATTAADMYAALRPRSGVDSETEFRRYADASMLVLDDLGAAKDTEWTEEINYRLINHRYEQTRPTLVTSNVPPAQLVAKLGERVSSRLLGMCQRVVLKGDDRRKRAAA